MNSALRWVSNLPPFLLVFDFPDQNLAPRAHDHGTVAFQVLDEHEATQRKAHDDGAQILGRHAFAGLDFRIAVVAAVQARRGGRSRQRSRVRGWCRPSSRSMRRTIFHIKKKNRTANGETSDKQRCGTPIDRANGSGEKTVSDR